MRIKKHWHKYDTDVTQTDFWWLIQQAERAQELERMNSRAADTFQQCEDDYVAENARLKKSLEFYAEKTKYMYTSRRLSGHPKIIDDAGVTAQQALKGESV